MDIHTNSSRRSEEDCQRIQKTVNTLSGFMKTLEIVRELLLTDDLDLPNHDSPQELLKRMAGFQTSKPGVFQTKALESV